MRVSSAKAKGRRCAQEIKDLLLEHAKALGYELEEDDILVTPSGVPGEDLKLSPAARKIFPWTIEAKNQETAKIWEWMRQAKTHSDKYTPMVIFKRNRETLKVCLELQDFLNLMKLSTPSRG